MAVTVTTGQPYYVRGTSGYFKGELTDMNSIAAIDCYFEYRIKGAATWTNDTSAAAEELTAVGEFVSASITLTEGETYEVRAVATWMDGTAQYAYGSTVEFDAAWIREGSEEDFERGILDGVQALSHRVLATFTTAGTDSWTVPAGVSAVDVLVVAGGGGGGSRQGGGGGAGGLIFEESFSVTPEATISVTVGAGGAGGTGGGRGTNGSDSVFSTLTATGGGGGGGRTTDNTGSAGGSGGGGAWSQAGGAGTAGQGYAGGSGIANSGGGGGGASEVGANGTGEDSIGGAGGDGLDYSTQFGTSVGETGYFAGGGGGGSYCNLIDSAGGTGGGGDGASLNNTETMKVGEAGTANTGGGGGGSTDDGNAGGAGGSGIVIIAVKSGVLGETGNRQMPYVITDTSADIAWTATTPTNTTLTVEAQVQGTTTITDEAVGTGDGVTTVFYLDHWPANTPTITVNAVAETGFTLSDDRRTITFTTAPADTHVIVASYTAVDDPVVDVGEIQELDLDSPAGGTFKLGDGSTWTADIAYNATAATIETALEGLYGAGSVSVEQELGATIITDINIGDSYSNADGTFHHVLVECTSSFRGRLIFVPISGAAGSGTVEIGECDDANGTNYTTIATQTVTAGQTEIVFEDVFLTSGNYYVFGHGYNVARFDNKYRPAGTYLNIVKSAYTKASIGTDPYNRTYGFDTYKLQPHSTVFTTTFAHSVGNSNLEADFTGLT